jgi:hypothetical protein
MALPTFRLIELSDSERKVLLEEADQYLNEVISARIYPKYEKPL